MTRELCNISSVSGNECEIVNWLERFFAELNTKSTKSGKMDNGSGDIENACTFQVTRIENRLVARTDFGLSNRVILAGHIDTVPISTKTNNFPSVTEQIDGVEYIIGRGSVDMKAGDGVFLALAEKVAQNTQNSIIPQSDITFIFYDNEEVDASLNGLGLLAKSHPQLLAADFAILGEPTNGVVEAGCNGTLRFDIVLSGQSSHSARAWIGDNAIHKVQPVLEILNKFNNVYYTNDNTAPEQKQNIGIRTVNVDGLDYVESLNATKISGGIAANVIPDECRVHINYRFAPAKSLDDAKNIINELFQGFVIAYKDESPGARPGLNLPAVQNFAELVNKKLGSQIKAKLGWTDVARFSALGIPALNFAPGDPLLCHHDDEMCATAQIEQVYGVLENFFFTISS